MAHIRLQFTPASVTIGDLISLEMGITSPVQMRDFLAKFVIDENDAVLDHEAAKAVINAMTLAEVEQTVKQFSESMQEQGVPPTQGIS